MLGLGDNKFVIFPNDGPALRMAKDDPFETSILEMLGADFSSIGSEPIVGCILSSNLDILVLEGVLDSRNVQIDWGNDDIDFGWVELQGVDGIVDQSC